MVRVSHARLGPGAPSPVPVGRAPGSGSDNRCSPLRPSSLRNMGGGGGGGQVRQVRQEQRPGDTEQGNRSRAGTASAGRQVWFGR